MAEQSEKLPLSKAAEFLLDECRMVLPGIQALFGFQLIVVFNASFAEKLTVREQYVHLVAIALVALGAALIMTPAALHRGSGGTVVVESFILISSRVLLASMLPLAVGISLDFYLISRIILGSKAVAILAAGLFACFIVLWFILPRSKTLQKLVGAREK